MNSPAMFVLLALWSYIGTSFSAAVTSDSSHLENSSALNKCLSDFKNIYGWDNAIDAHVKDELLTYTLSLSNYECTDEWFQKESNCSIIKDYISNATEFAMFCTKKGITVTKMNQSNPSCDNSNEIVKNATHLFCRFNSSLDCYHGNFVGMNALTLFFSACLKTIKYTTTSIPLLPNPISPDAITAVVVIVCLGIIAILAGFFFWPKCHNPKAGLFPRKKQFEMAKVEFGNERSGINNFRGSSNA